MVGTVAGTHRPNLTRAHPRTRTVRSPGKYIQENFGSVNLCAHATCRSVSAFYVTEFSRNRHTRVTKRLLRFATMTAHSSPAPTSLHRSRLNNPENPTRRTVHVA